MSSRWGVSSMTSFRLPSSVSPGPRLGRPALVREGEKGGPLHVRRRLDEDGRLPLPVRVPAIVHVDLARAISTPTGDAHGELLVPVVPPPGAVLQRLPSLEYLAGGLGSGRSERERREREDRQDARSRHACAT